MIRWRLLIEEFHPQVKQAAGSNNLSRDAILRLDAEDRLFNVIKWELPHQKLWYSDYDNPNTKLVKLISESEFEPDGFDDFLYSFCLK